MAYLGNVPDDWNSYSRYCDTCHSTWHASEGRCGCDDDRTPDAAEQIALDYSAALRWIESATGRTVSTRLVRHGSEVVVSVGGHDWLDMEPDDVRMTLEDLEYLASHFPTPESDSLSHVRRRIWTLAETGAEYSASNDRYERGIGSGLTIAATAMLSELNR